MKKRAIPSVPQGLDRQTANMLAALKENVEVITGVRGSKLPQLSSSATLQEVIATVNALLTRIQ